MKILIVDDELPIREWLKISIQNLLREQDIILTAANGKEAWNSFIENKPDMVVTDIKMPKMDGLEFLCRMKETRPDIYVIMLTSYNDFEYAREAIKHQANEYILKNEINAEILQQIIKNFYKYIENKEPRHGNPRFISEMLKDKTAEAELGNYPKEKIFAIALKNNTESNSYESHLNNFIEKISHYYYEKNISILICTYKKEYSEVACFNDAMTFCRQICDLNDTGVGFSGFDKNAVDASIAARTALNIEFYQKRNSIYLYKDENEEIKLEFRNIRRKIISLIHKDRQNDAENSLEDLLQFTEKNQILDLELVRGCFIDIIDAYKVSKIEFTGHEHEELCEKIKENICCVDSFFELKNCMCAFMQELKGSYTINEKPYSKYVKTAMFYVSENYNKIQSLSEVSDYVNINMEYFCRIFKSETGITFNGYLTDYRIKKAVELLENSDLKVYEIAEQVGYTNLSYFSRVFKKVTGVNPFSYKH